MQNEQTFNPQSPKPSHSKDSNSQSVRSFGSVEDFEFSSDESLSKVPSQNTIPEAVVAEPRKRSNALVAPLSPQVNTFYEQECNHLRNISVSSKGTRYSTLTDFDSECIPSLLFNNHESGEFDFSRQPDNKFSDMMNSNKGNILEVVHSDREDFPGLERSDMLSKHLKKAIPMPRRAQSESCRKSQVGWKFRKIGSLTLPSSLQFCSPCLPEDKRIDACTIM